MDTGDPEFLPRLMKPRTDVQEHARAEERHEFTHIRRSADVTNLAAMAKAVKAAPSPALVDRTKDAVRKPMGKD
ncbi:hypothetical protein [Streptomyces sp. NPDC017673]|uniref:hypothetical protein n=1 Tax=unclassified Streptomyces TaxID=2593676 RepID=UPI0037B770FA